MRNARRSTTAPAVPPIAGDLAIDARSDRRRSASPSPRASAREVDRPRRVRRRPRLHRPAHPFGRLAAQRSGLPQRHRAGHHDAGRRAVRVLGRAASAESLRGHDRGGAGLRVPGRRLGLDDDRRLSRGRGRAPGPATNVTTFVGHNTLRRFVIGGADRPPTAAELERMRSLVREAIDEGARGFTTGLSYAPGLFASVEELAALAGVAAERGLMYHTHMRYGDARRARARSSRRSRPPSAPGSILNISHMYPRANQPLEEADDPAGHARRRPGARHRGDLRPDDLPARRRRLGPVAAGLGARRRARRQRRRSSATRHHGRA